MTINHRTYLGSSMGAGRLNAHPEPHHNLSLQVSIAVPEHFMRLKNARVLPATSFNAGNSNLALRVRKNTEWDGTLGIL